MLTNLLDNGHTVTAFERSPDAWLSWEAEDGPLPAAVEVRSFWAFIFCPISLDPPPDPPCVYELYRDLRRSFTAISWTTPPSLPSSQLSTRSSTLRCSSHRR